MKSGIGIATVLVGLALMPGALRAGQGGDETKPPKTRVHRQLNQLIRQDARIANPSEALVVGEPAVPATETLVLEPMVVEEEKLKNLPPPEPPVKRFFRIGTIWERIGRKFTQRFWVNGGRGVGFTLSW